MALKFLNDGYFAGKVGIGTASPDDILQVNQGSSSFRGITIKGTSPALYLNDTQASNAYHIGANGDYLYFLEDSNKSGSYNNILAYWDPSNNFIFNSGNVGIGTTSPTDKLDIAGAARFTSNISFSSSKAGRIYKASNHGLAMQGVTGTENDLAIFSPTGSLRIVVPTGTNNLVLNRDLGDVGIGTASPLGRLQVNEYTVASQGNQNIHGELSVFANSGAESLFLGIKNAAYPNRGWAFNPVTSGVNSDLQIKEHGASGVRMTIKSGGNVGIGTTTPSYKLSVNGTIQSDLIRGYTYPDHSFLDFDYDQTAVTNSTALTSIARVSYISDSNGNDPATSIGHSFMTGTTDSDTATPLLTILNNGNVGIGTTSPSRKLVVSGAANGIIQSNDTAGAGSFLRILADVTAENLINWDKDTDLRFCTSDEGFGNFSERMRIDSSGNVGIGRSSSITARLFVQGPVDTATISTSSTPAARINNGGAISNWIGSNGYNYGYIQSIQDDGSNNLKPLSLQPLGGNVGIGTTNPPVKLVVSNGGASGLEFNPIGGVGNNAYIQSYNRSTNSYENLTYYANNHYFNYGSSTRMIIQAGGNVGIGTTSPGAKLVVASTTNDNTTVNTVKISHARSNTDVGTNAVYVDMNLSGADATTADRQNRGVYVDIDSTANGDASNEHRIRGFNSDVRFSGFSDIVQSGYFYAESNNSTVKTAQLIGAYGHSVHDSSTTTGGVSNMYGVYGLSDIQDLGDVDNAFGGFFQVNIGGARGNANIGITKGIEGQINIDKSTTIDYGTMSAVSAVIDNNEGAVPNFGNQFLFRGDYQGDRGSDAYGIYCEGDKHYLEGKLAINLATPTQVLHVAGNARVTGAYYDSNNSPGTANQVLVSTVTGTDWVDGSAIPGVPAGSGAAGQVTVWSSNDVITGYTRFKVYDAGGQIQITDGTRDIRINSGYAGSTAMIGTSSSHDLGFMTGNSQRVTIDNSGNVGIGTTSPGYKLDISGALRATGESTFTNNLLFPDNSRIKLGNGNDLQIYHDGSNSFIDNSTGNLTIDSGVHLLARTATGESLANFYANGANELFYDNSKKFETTSTGVSVTGGVVIDSALLSNQENTDIDSAAAEMVAQVSITSYTAAFFDFVVKKGTNVRSGTVYACHDGTSVEFTETSTQDLGDTSDVVLSVDISGGNMRLMATVASDDWSVKSLIRAI